MCLVTLAECQLNACCVLFVFDVSVGMRCVCLWCALCTFVVCLLCACCELFLILCAFDMRIVCLVYAIGMRQLRCLHAYCVFEYDCYMFHVCVVCGCCIPVVCVVCFV